MRPSVTGSPAELRNRGQLVEVLVNNAGFGHQADFARSPRERMVEMVRINVEAVVDLTSRFLTGMVERGRGSVINIASTAAFQPLPGSAVYAATKAFVLSFSEAIRTELRGSGVTVTAVCPGPVRTEFTEVAGFGRASRTRTPAIVWMSAEDVARHAVDGAEHEQARRRPRRPQPRDGTGRAAQPAGRRAAADQPDLAQRLAHAGARRPVASRSPGASGARAGRSCWSTRRPPRERSGSRWRAALSEGARAISYDRRGWGGSSAPDGYRRTTVEEQSEDAAALIESAAEAPAVVCGAGLGAVIALDLLLRRPDLASAGAADRAAVAAAPAGRHRGALGRPTPTGGRRLARRMIWSSSTSPAGCRRSGRASAGCRR